MRALLENFMSKNFLPSNVVQFKKKLFLQKFFGSTK